MRLDEDQEVLEHDVEDCAELVFERVEDDDDCASEVANVFGIGLLNDTDIAGKVGPYRRQGIGSRLGVIRAYPDIG